MNPPATPTHPLEGPSAKLSQLLLLPLAFVCHQRPLLHGSVYGPTSPWRVGHTLTSNLPSSHPWARATLLYTGSFC